MSKHYQIAVNFPKKQSIFTYLSDFELLSGDLVDVPFGKRTAQGTVLSHSTSTEIEDAKKFEIKKVKGRVENSFLLSSNELNLYQWMSRYYHYSLGKLIFDCLPKILKRPRPVDFINGSGEPIGFQLNKDQNQVVESFLSKLSKGFSQSYVHGVTGSGKSVIYLELMKASLAQGKSVQFLLPEINLTPQFTKMFETYLDCPIYTYHSGVTPSEKYHIWKALKEEKKPVLLMGVRSSIFLPIENLGLIIVDEEHDQSFKQNDRCPYNGRDVAIKKAQIHDVPILLGSATPTLENFYGFSTSETSKKEYYTLENRVGDGNFPKLDILSIKDKFKEADSTWPLLEESIDAINLALEKREQVLVFINKLGYSTYIQCRNCAHQFYNDHCGCQNNLRYFKKKNCLSCSHCEFTMPLPDQCPECGGISLINKGFGTERVEQLLTSLFPDKNIERFDRDEIKTTKELNQKLDRFHKGEIDIFVGTQMMAKGHNFKKVNLVVILGIDSMLNYSDFRSSEKTFQLVEQIAGRAGRYAKDSKVIIQTMNPEHKIFELIKNHSFDGFYKEEIPLRELCHCPPFGKIVIIAFSSRFRDKLVGIINNVGSQLQNFIASHAPKVSLYGPTPMAIEKKANQYTWAIMLKSQDIGELHRVISTFEANYSEVPSVSFKIDVDPMQIL